MIGGSALGADALAGALARQLSGVSLAGQASGGMALAPALNTEAVLGGGAVALSVVVLENAIKQMMQDGGLFNDSTDINSKNSVPDKARDIAKRVKDNNGTPPKGYKGGKTYKNVPTEEGAQKLPDGTTYISLLRKKGVTLARGLTTREVERAERGCNIKFPKSLKTILMMAMPTGKGFYNLLLTS